MSTARGVPGEERAATDLMEAGGPSAREAGDVPGARSTAGVRLVVMLGLMISLGPLSVDMYLPALPRLAADLGATPSQVQLTLTGTLVGLAVGQLLIGPVSDAVGRRRPLLLGIVMYVLVSAMCVVAPTIEVLGALRVAQGAGSAAVSVVAMATVRDLFSGTAAATLLSRLILVMGVGPVVAPTLGSTVLAFGSWRAIFGVMALLGLVILGIAFFGMTETLPPRRRRPGGFAGTMLAYRVLLGDRVFVGLLLMSGMSMAGLFAYISGSSFVLQDGFGLSPRAFALVFGMGAIGLIVASQANVVLLRRYRPAQILSAAVLAASVAAVVMLGCALTGVGGVAGIVAPVFVLLASIALAGPNAAALALSRHGERAGTAAALLGGGQFAIGALAAPLAGLGRNGSAVPMATVIASVFVLALVSRITLVGRQAGSPVPA